MATWSDYKNHVRATNPEIAKDIDEVEALSQIVGAMIEQRHNLDLSQRDLAELCGLPHSSIARIESGKSTPNLSTLLKIFRQLGLSFTISPVSQTATPEKSNTPQQATGHQTCNAAELRGIWSSLRSGRR